MSKTNYDRVAEMGKEIITTNLLSASILGLNNAMNANTASVLANSFAWQVQAAAIANSTLAVFNNSLELIGNSANLMCSSFAAITAAAAEMSLMGAFAASTIVIGLNSVALAGNTVVALANSVVKGICTVIEWGYAAAILLQTVLTEKSEMATLKSLLASKSSVGLTIAEAAAKWVLNGALVTALILSTMGAGSGTALMAVAAGTGVAIGGAATSLAVGMPLLAMATGGVATGTTVAMIGEGRYPEAVVPLGNSPQFASMKADIASAVMQGIAAMGLGGKSSGNAGTEVILNIDGSKLARVVIPAIERENKRRGMSMQLREV